MKLKTANIYLVQSGGIRPVPGGTADDQVTICDLTGTGAQDTAIASFAVAAARKTGAGVKITT